MPVAAVTPPSPGWQPATVASATAASPTDRPTTPTDGWHGPACTQSAGHGAARRSRLGLGSPRHRVTQDSGGSIVFSRLGHHTGPTRSFARSTIDEVLDRLRIMGGLPKIRTPGAQTGRCARPGIKIVGALVWWGGRRTVSLSKVRRSIATSSIDANIGRFHHCSSTSSSIATSSTSSSIDESAQCAQPGGACLALPCAHDHQDPIGAHDRRRLATTAPALGRMAAQLAEIVLDVAERDLACTAQTVDRPWRRCRQTRRCVGPQREDRPSATPGVATVRPATTPQMPCGTGVVTYQLVSISLACELAQHCALLGQPENAAAGGGHGVRWRRCLAIAIRFGA